MVQGKNAEYPKKLVAVTFKFNNPTGYSSGIVPISCNETESKV